MLTMLPVYFVQTTEDVHIHRIKAGARPNDRILRVIVFHILIGQFAGSSYTVRV